MWLQSPDVLIVTPIGRFRSWEGVKEIWSTTRRQFSERRFTPITSVSLSPTDAAWLVFDFVFTATLLDRNVLPLKGWESHGYRRTGDGWRIVHLHYSLPSSDPTA